MSNRPFDLNKVPDFSPAMEIGPGSRRSGVDVQVSVDLLLRAKDQLMKSADVDPPSKKILDDLINSVIEPLDLGAAVEKNRFLRYKVYIGLLSFFVCVSIRFGCCYLRCRYDS